MPWLQITSTAPQGKNQTQWFDRQCSLLCVGYGSSNGRTHAPWRLRHPCPAALDNESFKFSEVKQVVINYIHIGNYSAIEGRFPEIVDGRIGRLVEV